MGNNVLSSAFSDTKPHYGLLDGLRGIAALLVVFYHIFEGFSFAGGGTVIRTINHGYLAVDFFFMLSGFVIGYAYDDRWKKNMTLRYFFSRRLIRLHPMIVMGAVIGLVCFIIQGCVKWDGTQVPLSAVMTAFLFAVFLIPAYPGAGYDVRGNGELFPLNGPVWSLFFEYIGNILYALFIRRLGNRSLAVLVIFLGMGLSWFAISDVVGYGMIGVGWTLDGLNFLGGMFRMLFPLTVGMLLSRNFRPLRIRGAFWICSAVLIALFCVPYIGVMSAICLNGVFEMICIAIVFPFLVWIGASGETGDRFTADICRFLGDLSYPLYAVHYPLMYLFYSWLMEKGLYTLGETWQMSSMVYFGSIALACLCLKLYDEPVRKWLAGKFLKAGGKRN